MALSTIKTASIADDAITADKIINDGNLGNRNLIINGSMQVAQRGTSSTSSGYQTVDRFNIGSLGATITQSQESLTSGSPHDEGFNYFFRMTNTTAGSNAATDFVGLYHILEAQNVRSTSWNYASSSSYLSLQFWARSSVAGTYYTQIITYDGTQRGYNHPLVLAANTWTKFTLTIPGDSSIQIDNNNGQGLMVGFVPYYGTDYTSSSLNTNEWYNHSASPQAPDFAQNWMATTSATFDVTGVQLEVGEQATPFEHRSYGDELARCQRYYVRYPNIDDASATMYYTQGMIYGTSVIYYTLTLPVPMREQPDLTISNAAHFQSVDSGTIRNLTNLTLLGDAFIDNKVVSLQGTGAGMTAHRPSILRGDGTAGSYFAFYAEL